MVQAITIDLPRDYRLLLTGYLPDYLHDLGALQPGRDLAQLRQLGHINKCARWADQTVDFSARIRDGVPGWP
jgi:hypothetical protein